MTKRMELPNQEKIRTLGGKEMYEYLGILKTDAMKQVGVKEKIKILSLENKKATRNQTKQQEPFKREECLVCPPRKILRIILEVDERREQEN